ncbi:peptidase [Micromonospora sp. NBC_01699]|uniref:peptidase n=1 Tax=Micromonospora sp. NBC_01699 TaxID=2975984 RepID=UPI002E2A895F|nr:peptidase [Micromonospora sp. NBC_01699]
MPPTETTTMARLGVTAVAVAVGILLPAGVASAAPASPLPTPSPGAVTVTKAGTSFLTATGITAGQPVNVAGSTGDYLYWSFAASAGQTSDVAVNVTLPPAADRHGPSTWTVDVFDGLRRRQACTAGAQAPTAAATDTTVALNCILRQVRAWAEPWSGDPLPGTYYVRLSTTELPEQDLGLPIQVELLVGAVDDDNIVPEDGDLKTPLVPAVEPGAILPAGGTAATPDASASPDPAAQAANEDEGFFFGWFDGWFDGFSSRWIWTAAGGVLAAVAGVVGFALTRRPRRVVVR